MALDWLTGSKTKTSQNTDFAKEGEQSTSSNQTSTSSGSSQQNQTQQQQTNVTQTGTQTTSSLDKQSLDILQNTLANLSNFGNIFGQGTQVATGVLSDFASQLAQQVPQSVDAINQQTESAIAEEQLNFDRDVMAGVNTAAQGVGSLENGGVIALGNRAREDLAVRLAGIRSGGAVAAEQARQQASSQALQGLMASLSGQQQLDQGQSAAIDNIAQIANILKGATQTSTQTGTTAGTTTGQTQTNTQQQMTVQEILDAITKSQEKGTAVTTGTSKSSQSPLDVVNTVVGWG